MSNKYFKFLIDYGCNRKDDVVRIEKETKYKIFYADREFRYVFLYTKESKFFKKVFEYVDGENLTPA